MPVFNRYEGPTDADVNAYESECDRLEREADEVAAEEYQTRD